MKKSLAVYGNIFTRARTVTAEHKELWIFGVVASFATTGGILLRLSNLLHYLRPNERLVLENAQNILLATPRLQIILKHATTLTNTELLFTIAAAGILLLALALFVMAGQHILIDSLARKASAKKNLNIHRIIRSVQHAHLWRLLTVNITTYLASLLLIAAGSVIIPLLLHVSQSDVLVYIGAYGTLLPLLFCINILGMFTLIHIVDRKMSIAKSFTLSLSHIRSHFLTSFETALLLFVVNILLIVAFTSGFVLFAVCSLLFYFAAFTGGIPLLPVLIGTLFVIGSSLIYLCYFGIITTFNYSVWIQLLKRIHRYSLLPGLEGATRKVLGILRSRV